MVFTFIYGVIDGLFVTNFAGKTALAAINFAFPILNILATFGYMFGVGGSALVAKTLGEGNKQKANGLFSTFVYISTLIGFLFTALGFIFLRPILIFLGAEDELLRLSLIYGRILLIALPFWNLQFLFQMFFVTAEKPRLSLYVTLVAGITNIPLIYISSPFSAKSSFPLQKADF
jgi:Na+-driven multidrug efflux pump